MLDVDAFTLDDVVAIRDLVRRHPWALLVSAPRDGQAPVVSHLPVVVDPAEEGLVVLGHLGRPDEVTHDLGAHPVTVVIQGPHGYVSPTFYEAGPFVPTWNYVAAHLEGVPEVLTDTETYDVLEATVDHLEADRPQPWSLDSVSEYAHRIAPGTVGFRLRATRVLGKVKLSQDKSTEVVERVIAALETDAVHGNPELAAAMRRTAEPDT